MEWIFSNSKVCHLLDLPSPPPRPHPPTWEKPRCHVTVGRKAFGLAGGFKLILLVTLGLVQWRLPERN